MAIAEKRHIGADLVWLGVRRNSAVGVAIIPSNKRFRAIVDTKALADGVSGTVSELERLNGLLEHIRPILFLQRDTMHHFYSAMREGGSSSRPPLGPGDNIVITPELQSKASEWVATLASRSAALYADTFYERAKTPGTTNFALYSDAAKEASNEDVGLGGYFHSYWWSVSLRDAGLLELDVPIPCLEMLAAAVNLLVAAPFVRGCSTALYTDSLTTADFLQRNSAHSSLM